MLLILDRTLQPAILDMVIIDQEVEYVISVNITTIVS